jgi:hypothetical protein
MRAHVLVLVAAAVASLVAVRSGQAISSRSLIKLKNAGVSDGTIAVLVREKTLETAAFSVEDIVRLKQAGISEETIQMLLKESSCLRQRKPIVYGRQTRALQFTTAQDIIELKNAGISDDVLQAIIAVTAQPDADNTQKAWEMLNNAGLRIFLRGNGPD